MTTTTDNAPAPLDLDRLEDLARLLDRETLLVELLVFKLVSLRQLLLAAETRFLGWAADEVERAVEAVRSVELERALLLAGNAGSLSDLSGGAPAPYAALFSEQRAALLALGREVADQVEATRRLAGAGSDAVAGVLDKALEAGAPPRAAADTAAVSTYGPTAAWSTAAPPPRVERSL